MNGVEFYDMYEADNTNFDVVRLHTKIGDRRTVAVFCSASDLVREEYKEIASRFGRLVASNNHVLIDGHASTGIMKAVADGVFSISPDNHIGITTKWMKDIEPWYDEHPDLVCDDIGERIQRIIDITDIAVIMPGGCGSITEFFYILTEKNLGRYNGDIILCNFDGCYDFIIEQIYDSIAYMNTISEKVLEKFNIASDEHSLCELYNIMVSKKGDGL